MFARQCAVAQTRQHSQNIFVHTCKCISDVFFKNGIQKYVVNLCRFWRDTIHVDFRKNRLVAARANKARNHAGSPCRTRVTFAVATVCYKSYIPKHKSQEVRESIHQAIYSE